jgi:putative ABC transport system ATP-binding protein
VREEGKTLVLVTHDAEVAAACDRRLRLVDGAFAPSPP